jgi:hypothetical protein
MALSRSEWRSVPMSEDETRSVMSEPAIGMVFNPAMRGMNIHHEPGSESTEEQAAAQDGETMLPSRRTNIY